MCPSIILFIPLDNGLSHILPAHIKSGSSYEGLVSIQQNH